MLELTGASYRYAGFAREVLHDVDLRLDDGEIVGLVGPNEAGKSTLCLVASGLAPASIGGSLKGTLTLDRTREAIARLKLDHLVLRDPTRLSGGQAQLVGIASLLAMRPRHVILDEPTAQLDPAGTRLVGEA